MAGDGLTGSDETVHYDIGVAEAVILEDEDCFCVAFAENADGIGLSLAITVPLGGYSEQDEKLGQATYSLSDAMGNSFYGGVDAWQVDEMQPVIGLRLSDDAAQQFGLSRNLELTVPNSKRDEIVEGLRRVLVSGQ